LNPSTITEPTAPKCPRSAKLLSFEQVAKRLSCTVNEVWDLIHSCDLSTVEPFAGNEVTEAEFRRYRRKKERRRLEQERREKMEMAGKDPGAILLAELQKRQVPEDKLLTIPEIAQRLGRSPRYVWKLLRSYSLKTFLPLYGRCQPVVHESEVQRFLDRRALRLKCKKNRGWS
jgi:predicted DNA-binding transcriptional regulator AlpA